MGFKHTISKEVEASFCPHQYDEIIELLNKVPEYPNEEEKVLMHNLRLELEGRFGEHAWETFQQFLDGDGSSYSDVFAPLFHWVKAIHETCPGCTYLNGGYGRVNLYGFLRERLREVFFKRSHPLYRSCFRDHFPGELWLTSDARQGETSDSESSGFRFFMKKKNMPQDSLRSVVYRSFLTCEDPNGVVEYGTMRKSKTGSRKHKQKIEKTEISKESSRSLVLKEKELFSDGINDSSQVPPPCEILEVSKGAQKLNLMIDSWSRGLSFEGQSKDIARDLLKGALDLQDSLVILCKLQEASNYLGQMKKKHNYEGGIDERAERHDSDRLAEKCNHSEMQRGRVSVDGFSRSSVEELKKVIRDSLTRQNLLSVSLNEEKDSLFGPRKSDDFSDIPSTSSSQSSMVYSYNSTSVNCSASSTSKETKAKAPSVIAKLMGLEDFPAQRSPLPLRQSESKKNVNHPRLVETQSARNANILNRSEEPERKTLKEVIETMQLKGLLEVKDMELHHTSSHSRSKRWLDDQMPPVVLIKPLESKCTGEENSLLRNSSQEERLHSFRKLESREDSSSKSSSHGVGALELQEMHNKLEVKQDVFYKVKRNETPIKKFFREERAVNSREIRRKPEVKEPKTREKASAKVKLVSVPVNHKPQERESKKKHDNVRKVLPDRRVPVDKEKENAKAAAMSRTPSQFGATSTKSRKPDSEPIITKNRIQHQERTTQNPTWNRSAQSKPRSSIAQAKNNATRKARPARESMPSSSSCKHIYEGSNQANNMESISTMTSSGLEDQLITAEEKELSGIHLEDHGEDQKSSACAVPTENNQHGSSIESAEESKMFIDHRLETKGTTKKEVKIKQFLLSSPSFLSCAEDLFELHTHQHTTFMGDVNVINQKLLLDCANEHLQCKSRQISLAVHPLFWIDMVNPRTSITLDQLLDEVCDGFDKFGNYNKVEDDIPPIDTIRKMLESDFKCKETLACGVWDLGWEKGFSVDEADQVLGELENQVLSELIEEIIVDYPNKMVHSYSS